MADHGDFLESVLPASIDIEEMIVGRFSARQLTYLCVGGGIAYNLAFKIPSHVIGWPLAGIVAAAVYFFGFFKIRKYDRYLSEHAYYYFKFKNEQQIYLNK